MMLSPALLWMLTALAQDSPDAAARRAVERSLPYLEKEGLAWIRKHDCLSCHHVPFLLWSHQEARARGIALDEKKLAEWMDWSQKESKAQRRKLKLNEAALQEAALPPGILAKLAPLFKKVGLKEDAFLQELAKVLSPEELSAHRDALLKHAVREKGDGGGLDTMSQLLLGGGLPPPFAAFTRARLAELQTADGS